MSAETEKKEKEALGRTIWDLIAAILSNRLALGVLFLLIILAIVLAVRGQLRVGLGKDGWTFCLPCEPSSVGERGRGSALTEAPNAQTQHSAGKPFAKILNVPLNSTIIDAKTIIPEVIISSDNNFFTYSQTFLGYPMLIQETLSNGLTRDFEFTFIISGDSDRYCKGEEYRNFLKKLSANFGSSKYLGQSTQHTDGDGASTTDAVLLCFIRNYEDCEKKRDIVDEKFEFSGDYGRLTVTISNYQSYVREKGHSGWEELDSCLWKGEFIALQTTAKAENQ